MQVLQGLVNELQRGAQPERKRRLTVLGSQLGRLQGRRESRGLPVMAWLGDGITGMALRREERRLAFSAELSSDQLSVLWNEMAQLLR